MRKSRNMSINSTLSKFYRLRNRVLSQHYAEANLTVLQVSVLWAVYENDGCIQRELCDMLDVSPTVMVGVLSALEKSGLVERRYCPTNRRITNVYVTEAGIEKAKYVSGLIVKTETEHMALMSKEELAEFHRLLKKAYSSWQSVAEKNDNP